MSETSEATLSMRPRRRVSRAGACCRFKKRKKETRPSTNCTNEAAGKTAATTM
jgi:hypothetical protein